MSKICIVLTQYKRNHLEEQLIQIKKQTLKPDYLVVFQNENHVNINHLKEKYEFIHVKSDINTKFFGRFNYCFNIPADIFLILDDDIIPGNNCIQNYVSQCIKHNGIIGGNGRYCFNNKNKLKSLRDVGIRNLLLVDYVGHLWCFKKDWLYHMFSVKPFTYNTGEDMHLCFSCNILGGIKSYLAEHKNLDDCSDIKFNKYAVDEFSSFKVTPSNLRLNIQKYWVKKGLKYIISN